MIQRIQSLLLFGVTVCMFLIFVFPIWRTQELASQPENPTTVVVDAFYIIFLHQAVTVNQSAWYIAALAALAALTAMYTIFKFKNRTLQMKLGAFNLLVMSALLGSYFLAIRTAKDMLQQPGEGSFLLGFYLPIIGIILTIIANRYIKKDEKLVRSIDRLR
jgi:hypothetical protein